MHFLEVLTTEEHSKHKILAELRGGSRLSKKMLNAGSVCLSSPKFSRYPRMHLGRAMGGKHVGARLAQGNCRSSIRKLKKGKIFTISQY